MAILKNNCLIIEDSELIDKMVSGLYGHNQFCEDNLWYDIKQLQIIPSLNWHDLEQILPTILDLLAQHRNNEFLVLDVHKFSANKLSTTHLREFNIATVLLRDDTNENIIENIASLHIRVQTLAKEYNVQYHLLQKAPHINIEPF